MRISLSLAALAALTAFAQLPVSALASPTLDRSRSTKTDGVQAVSVMAYNVENLFDTKHDAGKDDWAYLPVSQKDASVRMECDKIKVFPWKMECLHLDWNDQVLAVKMQHVANAILAVNDGRGPDVLMLEEVENIGVLHMLNSQYLQAAGYTTEILIEGNDDRGIDQAMLTRLPVLENAVNDSMPLTDPSARKDASRTRGLLHATFALPDGTPLTVFGVHLPSGGEAHAQRVQALDFLNQKASAYPQDRLMIVGGDFNINADEDAQFSVYSQTLNSWMISHAIGCQGCKGTEYYKTKKQWSFLDALGFSKNFAGRQGPWSVDAASIQIPQTYAEQVNADGTPRHFEAATQNGVSDHLPIFAILRKN